jgi:WD40 repeat protein
VIRAVAWLWASPAAFLGWLSDRLFGYDVFVSYAWKDGPLYPAELAKRLQASGYKVFLDKLEYVAGTPLRQATRRRVRMSRMLVVVLRPNAVQSEWVLREVREALDAGRKPVLIDVNGTFGDAAAANPLKELLADSLRILEILPVSAGPPPLGEEAAADRMIDGVPSAEVVEGIRRSFTFTRRETLQRRVMGAAILVFAVLAGVAGYLWRTSEARRARVERLLAASASRGVAAQAQVVAAEQPELGLLLAARSWDGARVLAGDQRAAADPAAQAALAEAHNALLRNLQLHPRLRGHMYGHGGAVESLSFDRAGRLLVSSGGDKFVRLWEWPTRRLVASLDAGGNVIDSAVSADGRFVLACAGDAVRIWQSEPPYQLAGTEAVRSSYRVAVAPAGNLCAVGTSSGQLFLLELPPRSPAKAAPRQLRAEERGAVHALCFSGDGTLLFVSEGGTPPAVEVWDVAAGLKTGRSFTGHRFLAHRLVLSPDGGRLAAGTEDGSVVVWQVEDEKAVFGPHRSGSTVVSVAFADAGSRLLSSHEQSSVLFWDLARPGSEPQQMFGHRGGAFALAVHPKGGEFVTGGSDAVIRTWSTTGRSVLCVLLDSDAGGVHQLESVADGTALVARRSSEVVRWRLPAGGRAVELKVPESDGRELLAMTQDGLHVVQGSRWDAPSKELRVRPTHADAGGWSVSGLPKHADLVALGRDGGLLAVAAGLRPEKYAALFTRPVREGGAAVGYRLEGYTDNVRALAMNGDGTLLATAGSSELRVWDVAKLVESPASSASTALPEGTPTVLAFGPRSAVLACGLLDGTIIIITDPRRPGGAARALRRHTRSVSALSFDAPGRWMASAGSDGRVTLWDAESFAPVADLQGLGSADDYARALTFDSTGRWLAAATQLGQVLRWDTDPASWARRAREIAGRDLRPHEIEQFAPQ